MRQSDRTPPDRTLHVPTARERRAFSTVLSIEVNQAATVIGFALAHLGEDCGDGWEVPAQATCEIGVNTLALLLERNRQGEYFFFRPAVEMPHLVHPREDRKDHAAICNGIVQTQAGVESQAKDIVTT